MGKGGKAQTIGYKYYLGMHLGLCHGPIDAITRLQVDERDAWIGTNTGGSINVNAGSLFGGDSREGGVSGVVDVAMGGPAQTQNSYLVSKLGALIPAYRGIVGLIFRQAYLGNNPYLKTWAARGQRIHVRQNGIAQWYDAKAAIYPPVITAGVTPWRYLAIARADNTNRAAPSFNDSAWPIGTSPFGNKNWTFPSPAPGENGFSQTPSTLITAANAYWIRSTVSLTKVPSVLRVEAFIDNDALFYVNGTLVATLGGARGNFYTIDISGDQLQVGNNVIAVRFQDRVASDSGNWTWFDWRLIDLSTVDMNPAHIIRECLTDPDWGMGYTDGDIDDASFMSAADTFSNEGLGMSLLWDRSKNIEDFVATVNQHIDGALYVSRTTGKFVLKAIRGDYDEEDLLLLDESNIQSVTDPVKLSFGELTNSVTVTYWDASTGKDATVTVTDPALVQQQGVVINAPIQYPGFTNARNATIAAQRDLRALSSPLLSCTILAHQSAKVLNIGDVFKFSWAKWGVVNMVMRVTGIAYGTGRNKRVKITCSQDVFNTDTNIAVTVPDGSWTDPSAPPTAVPEQLATEAPYYELVQTLGQADTDNKLLTHPEIGYVISAAGRPSSAINARLYTDNGDGYLDTGAFDFAPIGYLQSNIGKTETTFFLTGGQDFDEVVEGTHFQIGDELLRIDVIDPETGEVEVGRGVLDTVPQNHLAGDVAMFWDRYAGFDPTEYVMSEMVDVKVVPISGAGVFPIEEATPMEVTLQSRAARPYAPGDFRLNDESYTSNAFYEGEVTATWTHRNRIEQTGGYLVDASEGDIGPEPGVTYRVRVYVDEVLDQTIEPAVSPQAITPIGSGLVRVEVHSLRDGLYSWQGPTHTFLNSNSRLMEDNDERYTEDGDARLVED